VSRRGGGEIRANSPTEKPSKAAADWKALCLRVRERERERGEEGEGGDLADERSKARWERGSNGGGLPEGEHAPSSSHRSSFLADLLSPALSDLWSVYSPRCGRSSAPSRASFSFLFFLGSFLGSSGRFAVDLTSFWLVGWFSS
jgi:hypothetical protein